MSELKLGMTDNADVAVWQQFLIVRGFLSGDTMRNMLDGDFGRQTEAATKAFQLQSALPPSGKVDAETAGAAAELGFIQAHSAPKRVAVSKFFSALGEQATATLHRIRDDHFFYTEEPFELNGLSYIARLEPHKHMDGPTLRYWHRGVTVYQADATASPNLVG